MGRKLPLIDFRPDELDQCSGKRLEVLQGDVGNIVECGIYSNVSERSNTFGSSSPRAFGLVAKMVLLVLLSNIVSLSGPILIIATRNGDIRFSVYLPGSFIILVTVLDGKCLLGLGRCHLRQKPSFAREPLHGGGSRNAMQKMIEPLERANALICTRWCSACKKGEDGAQEND